MNFEGSSLADSVPGEGLPRAELASQSRAHAAVGAVLRHLVATGENALFAEELIARTRGMIESLGLELLRQISDAAVIRHSAALSDALINHSALLAHCHAQALEGQIVQKLGARGIDPLLPPLVQSSIAAADPETRALGVSLMAAQTRFMRRLHRMELSYSELPGDILHDCCETLSAIVGAEADAPIARLRAGFDERKARLAILARMALGLGDDGAAGLDLARAGVSLFVTALSLATGVDRDGAMVACADGQQLRLALLLTIAGLAPSAREATILQLHPDAQPAAHWLTLDATTAAGLLGQGRPA